MNYPSLITVEVQKEIIALYAKRLISLLDVLLETLIEPSDFDSFKVDILRIQLSTIEILVYQSDLIFIGTDILDVYLWFIRNSLCRNLWNLQCEDIVKKIAVVKKTVESFAEFHRVGKYKKYNLLLNGKVLIPPYKETYV